MGNGVIRFSLCVEDWGKGETNMNKRNAVILMAYGAFLILIGLLGYLSNPEKAKTALMSGGTFGLLQIGLGLLAMRGWRPATVVAVGVAALLGLVFSWRATVSWMAVAGGNADKLVAAVLITSMLSATVVVAGLLWIGRKKSAAGNLTA
jgi:hypothetical protein